MAIPELAEDRRENYYKIKVDIISDRYTTGGSRSKSYFNAYSTRELNHISYVFLQEMKRKLEVECMSLGDLFQT